MTEKSGIDPQYESPMIPELDPELEIPGLLGTEATLNSSQKRQNKGHSVLLKNPERLVMTRDRLQYIKIGLTNDGKAFRLEYYRDENGNVLVSRFSFMAMLLFTASSTVKMMESIPGLGSIQCIYVKDGSPCHQMFLDLQTCLMVARIFCSMKAGSLNYIPHQVVNNHRQAILPYLEDNLRDIWSVLDQSAAERMDIPEFHFDLCMEDIARVPKNHFKAYYVDDEELDRAAIRSSVVKKDQDFQQAMKQDSQDSVSKDLAISHQPVPGSQTIPVPSNYSLTAPMLDLPRSGLSPEQGIVHHLAQAIALMLEQAKPQILDQVRSEIVTEFQDKFRRQDNKIMELESQIREQKIKFMKIGRALGSFAPEEEVLNGNQ